MKLIRLACAGGVILVSGGCAGVHGLAVHNVVAGVPAVAFYPGSRPFGGRIIMRPTSSQSNAQKPLIVLDGRALKRAPESLDRNQIVKVHVLRNAVATKRYGMRAAGGAVLISTRR